MSKKHYRGGGHRHDHAAESPAHHHQPWQGGMRDGKTGSLTPLEQALGGRASDLGVAGFDRRLEVSVPTEPAPGTSSRLEAFKKRYAGVI